MPIQIFNFMHTHSSCKDFNMAGILVADGGLGLTTVDAENEEYKMCKTLN